MSVHNVNPGSRDVLDCARDLIEAFAQPELSAFKTNVPVPPKSEHAALWLAVALGRCRLFGPPLGQEDGVLPPRIALAAAEECSRQLRRRVEKAVTLAQEFDGKQEDAAEEEDREGLDYALEVVNFLFVCMDLWAALVAIDEAYHACVAAGDNIGAALRQAITRTVTESEALDEVMQDNIDAFCVAAETSLLDNWRSLLVEPYCSLVPWWLDGTLETANKCRKLREISRTQHEQASIHQDETPTVSPASESPPARPAGGIYKRFSPVSTADHVLAAETSSAKNRESATQEQTKEGLRILGRIPIRDQMYEIKTGSAGVFLSPSPGNDFHFLSLDGRQYALEIVESQPRVSLIRGLADDHAMQIIRDLRLIPDSHTLDLLR